MHAGLFANLGVKDGIIYHLTDNYNVIILPFNLLKLTTTKHKIMPSFLWRHYFTSYTVELSLITEFAIRFSFPSGVV